MKRIYHIYTTRIRKKLKDTVSHVSDHEKLDYWSPELQLAIEAKNLPTPQFKTQIKAFLIELECYTVDDFPAQVLDTHVKC